MRSVGRLRSFSVMRKITLIVLDDEVRGDVVLLGRKLSFSGFGIKTLNEFDDLFERVETNVKVACEVVEAFELEVVEMLLEYSEGKFLDVRFTLDCSRLRDQAFLQVACRDAGRVEQLNSFSASVRPAPW